MAEKKLMLVLVGHQGYIRHGASADDHAAENDILFGAISRTYLPLIRLLGRLSADRVACKFALVLSPVLCELLSDTVIQQQYIAWLDRRIALGERECERCQADAALLANAEAQLAQYRADKTDFCETYGQNLLKQFADYAKSGYLELVATAATYAFFPHYADMTEVLNAQVEAGLYSHRRYFGTASEGFWLPYLGYADGVDKVLRSYGVNYTILDARSVLFSENSPENGIFTPVRCHNSLVVFSRDNDSPDDITSPDAGILYHGAYKNLNKDIGFELGAAQLDGFLADDRVRIPTGYRYWARDGQVYDAQKAQECVRADATAFLQAKKQKLSEAAALLPPDEDACLVVTANVTAFGHDWAEGMDFLELVLRGADGFRFATGADLLQRQFSLPKITPYPSAANGTGYGEDLLDTTNAWLLRHTRKMCERMIDLAGRFPDDTGLKVRLLNVGAKSLMVAQSAEWQKMLHDGSHPEYVASRFKTCIASFIAVFDSLGSNQVSTEWLTTVERDNPLFPWMNYRIFSQKK